MKKILVIILVVIGLVSCKDEKKDPNQGDATKLPETFNVAFNLTVQKDDTFHLLYTEDGTLNFSDDKSVAVLVKGSTNPQDIIFKLPVDVLPTKIRLDFGKNKEQGDIVVNSMKAKYFSKVFEAKSNVVKQYFYFNDFQMSYDEKTSSVKPIVGKDGSYAPLMWSNELLTDEFVKLVK